MQAYIKCFTTTGSGAVTLAGYSKNSIQKAMLISCSALVTVTTFVPLTVATVFKQSQLCKFACMLVFTETHTLLCKPLLFRSTSNTSHAEQQKASASTQVNVIYQHTVYYTCSRTQAGQIQKSFIEPVGQYVQTRITVSAGMGQTPLAFESTRACV